MPISYDALVRDDRIHASLYTDPQIFADEKVVLVNAAEPLPNMSFLI